MRSAFTLIELLVVIAIVAILAVVVVLTLNPAEQLRASRDSQRLAELGTLNKAISLYQVDLSASSLGVASTVYVSIPSSQTNCSNLGLPTLPSGWSYACAPTSTYRNINGTGWIPIDFTAVSFKSPLGQLPVDPVNATTTLNYYTYTVGGTNSSQFEVTASMEAAKNRLGGSGDVVSDDGGLYPDLYEQGSRLSLEPLDYGDSALMGYWKFDEGVGTAAYDTSGRGNTGTIYGASWTNGKRGSALSFSSSSSNYVAMGIPVSLSYLSINNAVTVIAWVYMSNMSPRPSILSNSEYSLFLSANGYIYSYLKTADQGWHQAGQTISYTWTDSWHQVAMTYNSSGGTVNYYRDGVLVLSPAGTSGALTVGSYFNVGVENSQYINASLDEIRIYNRALSASEILALYNATR